MAGFIKLYRSTETDELLRRNKNAYVLLGVIAMRARRLDEPSLDGLEKDQAMIGDYRNYGMTEKEYIGAKRALANGGHVAFKGTNKGTIATILKKTIYDNNSKQKDGREDGQRAGEGMDEGRTKDEQRVTNKNERNNPPPIIPPSREVKVNLLVGKLGKDERERFIEWLNMRYNRYSEIVPVESQSVILAKILRMPKEIHLEAIENAIEYRAKTVNDPRLFDHTKQNESHGATNRKDGLVL